MSSTLGRRAPPPGDPISLVGFSGCTLVASMGSVKSQTSGARNPDRAPLWVFFFGDSICFGQGVSIYKGWVPRLSATLAQVGEERGRAVGVHNLSVNGNTTRLGSRAYAIRHSVARA